MKKILIAAAVLVFFASFVYAMDADTNEVMEELSVYVTNKAKRSVYVQYYVGPSWDSASSKGFQQVPAEAVNFLAKEGVTCYAKIGREGFSKNQRNVIHVNVYDIASPERRLLGTRSEKMYIFCDKNITRDKGNYWHIDISAEYKLEVRRVQLYTGRLDPSTNLGKAAAHRDLITTRTVQTTGLIALISLIVFLWSIKSGMMIGSKISKLGLLFLVLNSLMVITLCIFDVVDAIGTGSSGFAILPLVVLDPPGYFLGAPLAYYLSEFIPVSLDSAISVYDQRIIIRGSIFAITTLIVGGAQWYFIGWLISNRKKCFLPKNE